MDNYEKKQINITGQANRYQIKKLTQEKTKDKKRIEIEKLNKAIENLNAQLNKGITANAYLDYNKVDTNMNVARPH